MRVASLIICELIAKRNSFNEDPEGDKQSILIFLPGFAEIFQFIEYLSEFYDRMWLK